MINEGRDIKRANELFRSHRYEEALNIYSRLTSKFPKFSLDLNIACSIKRICISGEYANKSIDLLSKGEIGILNKLAEEKIILSLTSYPARISTVHLTIESLLRQIIKPGKIVLWLAREQFVNFENDLPDDLLALKEKGLEISWCEDLRSYKKIIPSLDSFPDKLIVTADDDILYKDDWLLNLFLTHIQHPNSIVCHRAHKVKINSNMALAKYREWSHDVEGSSPSYLNFFTGCGGVLYPPSTLSKKVTDRVLYESLCKTGDDIWLWGMALLNDTKIVRVRNSTFEIEFTPDSQSSALWIENVTGGENDKMLSKLLAFFPQISYKIINEIESSKADLVTIIVPVYNTGNYLKECLDCIASQTYKNIEVLCIDDGSTDVQTISILNHYEKFNQAIKVYKQSNSGPATARNLGIKLAKGKYVVFIDSDDLVSDGYVEDLVSAIRSNNSLIAIAGKVTNFKDDEVSVPKFTGFEAPRVADLTKVVADSIISTGVSCNKIYNRKYLIDQKIRYLDGKRCAAEDNYFTAVALIMARGRISFADNAEYFYRQVEGSITKSIDINGILDSMDVYRDLCKDISSRGFSNSSFWMNVIKLRAQRDLRYSLGLLNKYNDYEDSVNENFATRVDICCIADENYIHQTLVFLESIKRSKKKSTYVSVTVITSNEVVLQMAMLEVTRDLGFNVEILGVDLAPLKSLHKYATEDNFCMASPSAMFKFIIPDLFPDNERILYLDTDLIVRKDLTELYMQSMDEVYLCAVVDMWTPITNRAEAKISSTYFNSGVMLLNLDVMRNDNVSEKLIEAKAKSTNFDLMDQDVFNTVCMGYVKKLSVKFNFLPICYKRHKTKFQLNVLNDLYCENFKSIDDVAFDPVVSHWAGSDKPWKTSQTLYADEWANIYHSALLKYRISSIFNIQDS